MRLLFFVLSALAVLGAQPAPPLAGAWNGTLEAGGARLRLVLHIAGDSELTARIDSIDQGATDIPVTSVSRSGRTVRLELRQLQASFEGTLNGDASEIAGEWRQSGMTLPLVFRRGERPERPQEPKKPYPYREEDVVIENRKGGVRLAGTLTIPPAGARVPAVVLLTGSGAQDRDETIFGHRPFLVLADALTRRGFAVLRMDDRGVGGSTGSLADATLDDLADDALAAVEFLQARKEIDAKRVGLAGHSEGGIVAPIAAARSQTVAYLVLMAGPGLPAERVMYSQSALLGGMAEKNRELQRLFFAAVKAAPDREEREKRLRAIAAEFLDELGAEAKKSMPGLEKMLEAQVRAMSGPAFRALLLHDPAETLAKVKAPVLVISGAKDLQVKPELNLPPLGAALEAAGNPSYAIVKLAGLNHLLQTCRTGAIDEYATIEETLSPHALEVIGRWLERNVR